MKDKKDVNNDAGKTFRFNKKRSMYQYGALFVGLLLISASLGLALTRDFSTDGSGNLVDSSGGLIAAYSGSNVTYYSATGDNIIEAFKDLNNDGGTVYLPDGNFYPTETIYMQTDQALIGNGAGSTYIISRVNDGSSIIQVNSTNQVGGSIKNLRLSSDSGYDNGDGIRLEGSNYMFIIDQVSFRNVDGWSIRSNDTLVTEITNCKFALTGSGAINSTWGTSIDIHSNVFELYDGFGIHLDGTNGCWIHENWFENGPENTATHVKIQSYNRDTYYTTINNNRFADGGEYSIYLEQTGGNSIRWINIAENTINNPVLIHAEQTNIESNVFRGAGPYYTINVSLSNNKIINNNFYYLNSVPNIYIDSGGNCFGTVVRGNRFDGAYGILGHTCLDSIFEDNFFRDCTKPLQLNNTHESLISGNRISGEGDLMVGLYNSFHNTIQNNYFECNENATMLYGNSDENSILGNTFRDCITAVRIPYSSMDDNVIKDNILIDGTIEDSGTDTIILNNKNYNNNTLFPFYEQDTAPSINDNSTAYWYDTDDDYMYQVVNTYGDVFYVNMTTSI